MAYRILIGGISLIASAYLYLVYQQTETLLPGVLSIVVFAGGSYLLMGALNLPKSVGRILPFFIIGLSASLALVALGLSSEIAGSYYGMVLSYTSARLTSAVFAMAGTRVLVSGDVLSFPNGASLSIGPLCSGAYSSILFMLLSMVMVADVGRNAPRRKLAVALVLGLVGANLANVFRITFLASVMYVFGLSAMDVAHQFAGYTVFLAFMAGFWVLSLKWMRPLETP